MWWNHLKWNTGANRESENTLLVFFIYKKILKIVWNKLARGNLIALIDVDMRNAPPDTFTSVRQISIHPALLLWRGPSSSRRRHEKFITRHLYICPADVHPSLHLHIRLKNLHPSRHLYIRPIDVHPPAPPLMRSSFVGLLRWRRRANLGGQTHRAHHRARSET